MEAQIMKLEAPFDYIYCNGEVGKHIGTYIVGGVEPCRAYRLRSADTSENLALAFAYRRTVVLQRLLDYLTENVYK